MGEGVPLGESRSAGGGTTGLAADAASPMPLMLGFGAPLLPNQLDAWVGMAPLKPQPAILRLDAREPWARKQGRALVEKEPCLKCSWVDDARQICFDEEVFEAHQLLVRDPWGEWDERRV